jgi:hypothetical protein
MDFSAFFSIKYWQNVTKKTASFLQSFADEINTFFLAFLL